MINVKTAAEIELMSLAGKIAYTALHKAADAVKPGVSTGELDRIAEEVIRSAGAIPSFKNYRGYPATLCVSINEVIVHGIPSNKRLLLEGDLISLDVGALINGYHGDTAITVPVGEISPERRRLLDVGYEVLLKGIRAAVKGNRISNISRAVQETAEGNGYSVVRDFVGHGIGRNLHEDPMIPNYVSRGPDPKIRRGMTMAIEVMVNEGSWEAKVGDDGWTASTVDGKMSVHFEHTVAVTENGPVVLTNKAPVTLEEL